MLSEIVSATRESYIRSQADKLQRKYDETRNKSPIDIMIDARHNPLVPEESIRRFAYNAQDHLNSMLLMTGIQCPDSSTYDTYLEIVNPNYTRLNIGNTHIAVVIPISSGDYIVSAPYFVMNGHPLRNVKDPEINKYLDVRGGQGAKHEEFKLRIENAIEGAGPISFNTIKERLMMLGFEVKEGSIVDGKASTFQELDSLV